MNVPTGGAEEHSTASARGRRLAAGQAPLRQMRAQSTPQRHEEQTDGITISTAIGAGLDPPGVLLLARSDSEAADTREDAMAQSLNAALANLSLEERSADVSTAAPPINAHRVRNQQPRLRGRGGGRIAGGRRRNQLSSFQQHYDEHWHIAEAGFKVLDRSRPLFEPVPNDDELLKKTAASQ
jgi:hypothetical protein